MKTDTKTDARKAKKQAKSNEPAQPVPGVISTTEIYHHLEFRRRMRWGKAAWLAAKRAGLKVHHTSGRCYVSGQAAADYLAGLSD